MAAQPKAAGCESDGPDMRVNFNEAPSLVWYSKCIMYFRHVSDLLAVLCWKKPLSMKGRSTDFSAIIPQTWFCKRLIDCKGLVLFGLK